jgi:hypothetical protein
MDFYTLRARVIEILQREGRTSYRALKSHFALDDEYPADLDGTEHHVIKRLMRCLGNES